MALSNEYHGYDRGNTPPFAYRTSGSVPGTLKHAENTLGCHVATRNQTKLRRATYCAATWKTGNDAMTKKLSSVLCECLKAT